MDNGTYRARAVGASLGETAAGNEQAGIEFELLDFEGQRLVYYGSFTEKATEHTIRALRTAGWTGVDLSDLSGVGGPDAPEVSLVVENEEYEGKVRTKVKWVNAAGGATFKKALAPDKAKAFAAKMKGQLLAFDKSSGAKPAPRNNQSSPQSQPPPHTDSDMPPV